MANFKCFISSLPGEFNGKNPVKTDPQRNQWGSSPEAFLDEMLY